MNGTAAVARGFANVQGRKKTEKILARVSLLTLRLGKGVFSGHGTFGCNRLCKHNCDLNFV
eukprot:1468394-Karenia_brevis.AAC.1